MWFFPSAATFWLNTIWCHLIPCELCGVSSLMQYLTFHIRLICQFGVCFLSLSSTSTSIFKLYATNIYLIQVTNNFAVNFNPVCSINPEVEWRYCAGWGFRNIFNSTNSISDPGCVVGMGSSIYNKFSEKFCSVIHIFCEIDFITKGACILSFYVFF